VICHIGVQIFRISTGEKDEKKKGATKTTDNQLWMQGSFYGGAGFPNTPYEAASPEHLQQIHLRELVV
jgi:hypothetical protein